MSKTFCLLVVVFALSMVAYAEQDYGIVDGICIFEENQLYGLKNEEGQILAEAVYTDIEPFENGFIVAEQEGILTVMNKDGACIGTFNNAYVSDSVENRLIVRTSNEYILMDDSGSILLRKPAQGYCRFSDDRIIHEADNFAYIYGLDGIEIFSIACTRFEDYVNGYAVVRLSGDTYELCRLYSMLSFDSVVECIQNGYLLIDVDGQMLNNTYFSYTDGFRNDYANFITGWDGDWHTGLMDSTGNILFECSDCDYISNEISDERVRFVTNGLSGYKNTSGVTKIVAQWTWAYTYQNGVAIVGNGTDSFCIDINGNIIVSASEGEHFSICGNLIIIDGKNEELDIYHCNGKKLVDLNLVSIQSYEGENIFLAQAANQKYYYIDSDGKRLFHNEWLSAEVFVDGFAFVQFDNGLWGTINSSGETVLGPTYLEACINHDDAICVKSIDGTYYRAAASGEIIAPSSEEEFYSYLS